MGMVEYKQVLFYSYSSSKILLLEFQKKLFLPF